MADDVYLGFSLYKTGTGQIMKVHDPADCHGDRCVVHRPSEHSMSNFPTHWRRDRAIMERLCPHGIGHPDPDDWRVRQGGAAGIHGCDGCCRDK